MLNEFNTSLPRKIGQLMHDTVTVQIQHNDDAVTMINNN